jgi:hypothetical protein
MVNLALIGATCLADGHPAECEEPADGTIQGGSPLRVDSTDVATHSDDMHYPSHAHDYDGTCHNTQSHDLTPDQTPALRVDGDPIMRVDDDTTDPGSSGRAWIDTSGGNGVLRHGG